MLRYKGYLLNVGAKLLELFLAAMMLSSWYVRVEPAPYEYLFIGVALITVTIALLQKPWSKIIRGDFILIVSVLGFMITSAASLSNVFNEVSLRFLFITFYLIATGGVFAFVARMRYGYVARILLPSWCIAAFIASLLSYLGILGLPFLSWTVYGHSRAMAGFKDPNVYGAFLVPAAIFSSNKARFAKGKSVVYHCVTSGFIVAGIIFSFSRGALINAVVTGIVFLLAGPKLQWKHVCRMIFSGVVAIILVSTGFLLKPNLVKEAIERTGLMPYDTDRFATQTKASFLIAKHPWGIGPGQSEIVLQYSTHNTYLRVLLENGWAAFAFFLALLVTCSVVGIRILKLAPDDVDKSLKAVIFSALVGTLVNSCVIDTLHWRHFWMLIGLISGFNVSNNLRECTSI